MTDLTFNEAERKEYERYLDLLAEEYEYKRIQESEETAVEIAKSYTHKSE